jgi:hypothetical protein
MGIMHRSRDQSESTFVEVDRSDELSQRAMAAIAAHTGAAPASTIARRIRRVRGLTVSSNVKAATPYRTEGDER